MPDIRVVVGIDFGTTYSGFTYCHVEDRISTTNVDWPGDKGGLFKTNTVLQYNENLNDVELWGYPALSKRPTRRPDRNRRRYVVELFKLHIDNNENLRERYKLSVNYKKAITDYLRKIGDLIKETVTTCWEEIDFLENVLLVVTVPAEYTEGAKAIMRECVHKAGLISHRSSEKLQFTTEPEAAAIYCMENSLVEYDLTASGTTFMIVDCGGGTVDLTTRKLLDDNRLGEVTERAGDYCGSNFVDAEFINYLKKQLGSNAIDSLRDNYYGQMQYMVQEFCQHVKRLFTGDSSFNYKINLEEVSPILVQYVSDEVNLTNTSSEARRNIQKIRDDHWLINLDYETIKSMFDPVIERILRMIRIQLENCEKKKESGSVEKCSAMFLVGGFSQSEYLQKKIREEFGGRVEKISVPTNPIAAISRGAAIYGLGFSNMDDDMINMDGLSFVIDSRVIRYTYGIKILKDADYEVFHRIVRRGTRVNINDGFGVKVRPSFPFQTSGVFEIYYTREFEASSCKDPGMKLLGKLTIGWPDTELGINRPTTFKLTFGKMEIKATAKNETNGQNYQATFETDTMGD